MVWFVSWQEENGEHSKMFHTPESVWKWIDEYVSGHGKIPKCLAVFKAECVCDLS